MKRVATAVVLIPLVLLAVFKAPVWLFAGIVGAVALLATREYLDILEHYELRPFRVVLYGMVVIIFGLAAEESLQSPILHPSALRYFWTVLVVATVLILALGLRRDDFRIAFPSAAASGLGLLYVGFPLLLLVDFAMPSDYLPRSGRYHVFALLLFVWGADTFAYYTGRAIGRHKMAPRVSPGKTWEGAAGSMVGSIVAALIIGRLNPEKQLSLGYWIGAAILVNIAAQIGDLVESMIKRGAGIKDSGSLLPGHGSMLDRIDALLFAAPAMWYYPMIFYPLRYLLFRT